MLVENKFIYVSLPRCGSTSFYISCVKSGFKIEHFAQSFITTQNKSVNLDLDIEQLADTIAHIHERLDVLLSKFGNEYEIISVKRDKYQTFISIWKHIIDLTHMEGKLELSNILKKIKLDNILFYTYSELVSNEMTVVNEFVKRNKIEKYMTPGLYTMLSILIRHSSHWHNHNPKIKWFEFGNFTELEEWVTNKTGKPFKMERSNGSQHFECDLKLNDEFIKRYDNIYGYYENQKNNITLI
jgi:hypothetical protein